MMADSANTIYCTSVQLSILMSMEEMINRFEKERLMPPPLPVLIPKSERVKNLLAANFVNAIEVREYKEQCKTAQAAYDTAMAAFHERNRTREALQLLIKARKAYGNNTLLIPYDKFAELCERYGLTCGCIEDYTGDVPDENLMEILSMGNEPKDEIKDYVSKLYPVTEVRHPFLSDHEHVVTIKKKLDKFPFYLEFLMEGVLGKFKFVDGDCITAGLISLIHKDPVHFFIVAPEEMFNERYKITHILPKDPFICAHTQYGMLVFTRWGEEANDEIIKRFEQFNNRLDELGL